MREFVEMIVKQLVDDQESVRVTEVVGGHNTIIEVYVSAADFGKVIGKSGRHAEAIRMLVTGAAKSSKQQFRIAFIDPV